MSNLAEAITELSPKQREIFIKRLPPAAAEHAKEILTKYATKQAQSGKRVELLPHQKLPPPEKIKRGAVLAGGRGSGKSFGAAYYLARVAESTPGLRARVIAPTLSDAVHAVALDPDSGILAHSPSAQFKSSGVEGARIIWPNGAVCFLVGTPTLKDVDRLRALTNIDLDHYEEAAANPRLAEAVKQADLSRRGRRLHHPVWIASTTPRPVPTYKEWLKDPDVHVTHGTTMDNPHTPDQYREYAESLKGTHLYEQEILGNVMDDIQGALWTRVNLEKSLIRDPDVRTELFSVLERIVVGVDPPSGHGTCGIAVVGVTDRLKDPLGLARIVVLDDFSISSASPGQWGSRVLDAAQAYGASIVAERNQGGLMVESTIQQAAQSRGEDFVAVTLAQASISKERRASPVALLWEVDPQRALIAPPAGDVARIAELIDQLATWVPGTFSPDRLDAMVWAANYLMTGGSAPSGTLAQPIMRPRREVAGLRQILMGKATKR